MAIAYSVLRKANGRAFFDVTVFHPWQGDFMKQHIHLGLVSLLTAALLAACGGGDPTIPGSESPSGAPTTKGSFTALVTFGDSLSDQGTYSPVTSLAGNGQAPFFGGKFTTNGPAGTIWVENLAGTLGLVVTPAEMGYGASSVKCPAGLANAALAGTCTSYGQGGSRVTDVNGIGHAGGALTVPVSTQIANHLTRFGSFKATDLVILWGGNNDVFTQFGVFTAAATQIQANAAAGKISADVASKQLYDAQTAAQSALKQAAQELSGYVRDQVLAKGAKYVVVVNLPDSVNTPFGGTLPASVKPVLTTLVDTFNLWLRDGLAGQPVQWIDQNVAAKDVNANPAKYGLVNVTVPACDAAKITLITGGKITDGSSLACNTTAGAPYNGLRTGASETTWAFADGVHPTTGGHKLISDNFTAQLRAFGWI
jgi:phospholipase/lecithinase/hemolysin